MAQNGKIPHYRARWETNFRDCILQQEQRLLSVVGYIIDVAEQKSESVNCKDPTRFDLHIWLNDQRGVAKDKVKLIVEPTPWTTKPGWTLDRLRGIRDAGTLVRVSGYKLFDQWHKPPRHRLSGWEIHPVLEIVDLNTNKAL